MKAIKSVASLLFLMIIVMRADANGIDFRLASKSAEFIFLTQSSTFGYGGADIGFSVFTNDRDDLIGTASVLVSGSSTGDVRALHFGVGAKAYAGTLETIGSDKGGALAIGGQVRYVFPAATPLAVLGEIFFAPSVVSVGDFAGVREYRLALELEVTPSARAYVGYRFLEVQRETGGDLELDDQLHAGVRFSF